MSYILDALKKSEKERIRKRAPRVDSLTSDVPNNSALLSFKSITVLVLAVAIVNSAAIYLFFPKSQKEIFPKTRDMPLQSRPVTADESLHDRLTKSKLSDDNESKEIHAGGSKKSRSELPPSLEVTAHIYAYEPELRMSTINGVDRHEGDYIGTKHRLIKITELGLVLEYYGKSYTLNIVEEWQLN